MKNKFMFWLLGIVNSLSVSLSIYLILRASIEIADYYNTLPDVNFDFYLLALVALLFIFNVTNHQMKMFKKERDEEHPKRPLDNPKPIPKQPQKDEKFNKDYDDLKEARKYTYPPTPIEDTHEETRIDLLRELEEYDAEKKDLQ